MPPRPNCVGFDRPSTSCRPNSKPVQRPNPTAQKHEVQPHLGLDSILYTPWLLCTSQSHPHIAPPAFPTPWPYYCTTCAIYDPPRDPPFVCHTPYTIGNGNLKPSPQRWEAALSQRRNRRYPLSRARRGRHGRVRRPAQIALPAGIATPPRMTRGQTVGRKAPPPLIATARCA